MIETTFWINQKGFVTYFPNIVDSLNLIKPLWLIEKFHKPPIFIYFYCSMSQPPRLLPSAYCSAATGRPKHDRCGHHLASSEEKKRRHRESGDKTKWGCNHQVWGSYKVWTIKRYGFKLRNDGFSVLFMIIWPSKLGISTSNMGFQQQCCLC